MAECKTCPRCGETKALTEFGKNRSCKDGLQVYCRPCYNAYNQRYIEANPEKKARRDVLIAEWAQRNPDRNRAAVRRHYWRDPETARQKRRNLYALNRESEIKAALARIALRDPAEIRAVRRAYFKAHPERNAENRNRRRARIKGGGVWLVTKRDWERLKARYRHRCAYCGVKAPLTQEHVMPIARGGRHSIGNLLPVCKPCNCSKNSKLLIEWLREQRSDKGRIPSRAS